MKKSEPGPIGYEDTVTVPINKPDELIVNKFRPLTIEEERHNQRVVNAFVNRERNMTRAKKHTPPTETEAVAVPEVGKGLNPNPSSEKDFI